MTLVAEATTMDEGYADLCATMQEKLTTVMLAGQPLFTTDAENLFDRYLQGFADPAAKQYHTCHTCKRFIETYGGLVTIDESGNTKSVFWDIDTVPSVYEASVRLLARAVRRAEVDGVFLTKEHTWGTPITGEWTHFAVLPIKKELYTGIVLTPGQAMAEKREDHNTLARALADFSVETLKAAVNLLQTDSLYRSEKVLGVAKWLLERREERQVARGKQRDNLLWKAVATAPAGFCHPRSSMIGTLLDDIESGMSFDSVSRRFAQKMHPLQYQRPQAAPSAGNITRAEKLVEQLGVKESLRRRFARLEDLETIWTPTSEAHVPTAGGVFGHLKTKQDSNSDWKIVSKQPTTIMTWARFQRTVLPEARRIEFLVPLGRANYAAFITAVEPDAPLLFQWNNPVSSYVYHNGSMAENWNLVSNQYREVTAIALQPFMWSNQPTRNHTPGVLFALKAAYDREHKGSGLGLFPETLRSEFHPIRSTIEAYSKAGVIEEDDRASACGIIFSGNNDKTRPQFRVTTAFGQASYVLDRWE